MSLITPALFLIWIRRVSVGLRVSFLQSRPKHQPQFKLARFSRIYTGKQYPNIDLWQRLFYLIVELPPFAPTMPHFQDQSADLSLHAKPIHPSIHLTQ
ncbi:hypothetical protein F4808DRAFT_62995 [Astrocystis sublimbata]|nr:hypothetical protein F4808DRAFT_62995 [Astrocystis sublimbata]